MLLLTLALILSPPGSPDVPQLAGPVEAVARKLELGAWLDLNEARERWREMKDWPPVSDAQRFPPLNATTDAKEFNRDYRSALEERWLLRPWQYDQRHLDEVQRLHAIWDAAQDAQLSYDPYQRRNGLKVLRGMLGDAAYYAGEMPPPVPVWRMEQK